MPTRSSHVIEREWDLPRQIVQADGSTHFLSAARRTGAFWTAEEYQELIDMALDGASGEEIADHLGRSNGAITSRIRHILPGGKITGATAVTSLVMHLAEHPDWEEAVRACDGVLLDYSAIRALGALPADDPASITEAMGIADTTPERAMALLRKFGSAPETEDGADTASAVKPSWAPPALRVKNLLGDRTDHLPSRAHQGDAGLDLRYAGTSPLTITSREHVIVPTGVAIAVPEGFAGLVTPRSGLAAKHGLSIVNSPGVIDHGYTGEVKVMLITLGQGATATLEPGDRIAQLILTPVSTPDIELVDELDVSERGDGGLGSTGRA